MTRATVVAAALLALAGCAAPGSVGASPSATPSEVVVIEDHGEGLDLGIPGPATATYPNVAGYPACGTEPIEHEGTTWFPFHPTNEGDFPDVPAAASSGGMGGGTMRMFLPAVAAPGPGDDVGTLTVFEGGFAFWVSDSGDLDTWLTTTEIRYSWVC